MSEILEDLSDAALVAAIEDNLSDQFEILARYMPEATWRNDGRTQIFLTGIPSPAFNGVLRAQLDAGGLDAQIEDAMAQFKAIGAPMCWWTGPATRPADLGKHLQEHGLRHEYDFPGMATDLLTLREAEPPAGLTSKRVRDAQSLRMWCDVLTRGFGMPDLVGDVFQDAFVRTGLGDDLPWHWYLGLLEGEPVATSSIVLSAGVAGLYYAATLREARGRGIGTAMSLRPLLEAREMGYRAGILRSSEMGAGVYRRLGFREYCKIGRYVWEGEGGGNSVSPV
jgi:GNAT superfamily N-acetyltransferase